MRLAKIKLAGFKSFVDPTTVPLPSNLTGVVGPNGCGKSNIIDAVRWVMGETSAKHLRGDSMADVIFNGSNSRKPVGQASIELIFDNTDGQVGGRFANFNEIAIRREVRRDGASNYYLNGSRCRRRDVIDIFLGTGLGPRSYAIIEQGMISRLIEARPEDLRVFIEEAAGISKYKERRRETENRIKHTRENLDRLHDLREEIGKQLERLQRQARTAERYKELRGQAGRLHAELLVLRHQSLEAEAGQHEQAIRSQTLDQEAALAELRRHEAQTESARQAQTEAQDRLNEVQRHYYQLGSDLSRLEQGIQHAAEARERQTRELARLQGQRQELSQRIETDQARQVALREALAQTQLQHEEARAEAELAQEAAQAAHGDAQEAATAAEQALAAWQAEWERFQQSAAEPARLAEVERTNIAHLERQLLQDQTRRQRIDEELARLDDSALLARREEAEEAVLLAEEQVEDMTARREALITQLDQARRERGELQQALEAAQRQLTRQHGELVQLEARQAAALGEDDQVLRDWLAGHGLDQAPWLATQLSVQPGWERALEVVLGERLQAHCIEPLADLAALLAERPEGRLNLFQGGLAVAEDSTLAPGIQPLADLVQAPWPLAALLAGVGVTEDLDTALALRDRLRAGQCLVTRDGLCLGADWLRLSGGRDPRAGVLERKQAIAGLQAEVATLEAGVAVQETDLAQRRERIRSLDAERESLTQALHQAQQQLHRQRAEREALGNRLRQTGERRQAIGQERQELDVREAQIGDDLAAARGRLEQATEEMARHHDERVGREAERARLQQTLRTAREALQLALNQGRARAQQARDAAHQLALKLQGLKGDLAALDSGLARMGEQSEELARRGEELSEALAEGEAPLAGLREELAVCLAQRAEVEQQLNAARDHLAGLEGGLRDADQQRHRIESRLNTLREQLEAERLAFQEVRVRRQTLLEQIAETDFTLAQIQAELSPEADIDAWARSLTEVEGRIQRLGPINLAAIQEYEEAGERKQYLDAQNEDVTQALETLEEAIRRIDRETRTRFKDTFDKVNAGVQAMFPRLFGGGHAYLELTGEDLLDTGVSIMARPPGKRNSTIHLLSGGEKALTAVSMVFAIFQLNPSPFCLLDEVDAPLDDANVGRFCDMVREMSERVQFIFITHNKITMELAERLIGVTMHEPGCSRPVAVDVDEAVRMVGT